MSLLIKRLSLFCLTTILLCQVASAASLRVSPTSAEVVAPDSTTTFSLRNEAKRGLNVQIRVYRWTQNNGSEQLAPTTEVVASPPMAALKPDADYTVRLVRIAKAPVKGEESYRVVIDELPDLNKRQSGVVNLVVRHVLPVFFRNANAIAAAVNWKLVNTDGRSHLVATNSGEIHMRLSDLVLSRGSQPVYSSKGLTGYVLGMSSMSLPLPKTLTANGSYSLTATSTKGPVRADVTGR